MSETNGNPGTKRILWGRILFFVGLALILFGVVFGALWLPMGVGSPEEVLGLENIAITGLCCFGPFAMLGVLLTIVGAVLWFTR